MTKGGLELKPEQADILEKLISGDNRGNFTQGRNVLRGHVKITTEQVKQVTKLFDMGWSNTQIQKETKLSEWIVRGITNGRYDFLREVNQHGNESK